MNALSLLHWFRDLQRSIPTSPMRRRAVATCRLGLEQLEARLVLTSNPFTSSAIFGSAVQSLLQVYGIPEISVAADQGGQVYTDTQINDPFYTDNRLPVPAASSLTANSLFRVDSITKTFTAVAIMTLVQDDYLNLTDSALADLGYSPNVPLKGFDPVSGQPVSINLPPALFGITVADLMDMTSGLPDYNPSSGQTSDNIPVNSQTFTSNGNVVDLTGSYAALAFAGPPPYTAPATSLQQINYFLYDTASQYYQNSSILTAPGTQYTYNDFNYAMLGQLAQQLAQSKLQLSYQAFLQADVLAPLNIVMPPPDNQSVTSAAMVGFGSTQAGAIPDRSAVLQLSRPGPRPQRFPRPHQDHRPLLSDQ